GEMGDGAGPPGGGDAGSVQGRRRRRAVDGEDAEPPHANPRAHRPEARRLGQWAKRPGQRRQPFTAGIAEGGAARSTLPMESLTPTPRVTATAAGRRRGRMGGRGGPSARSRPATLSGGVPPRGGG